MTTFRLPSAPEYDADSPFTAPLAAAMVLNPIAIAEGASGAPKIATKVVSGSGSTVTFTSLGDFNGAQIKIYVADTGAAGANITLALSDDGATFSTASTIATLGSGAGWLSAETFIEFDTGWCNSVYMTASAVGQATPTVATPAGSVVAFRLSSSVGTITISALANPNGGRTAT